MATLPKTDGVMATIGRLQQFNCLKFMSGEWLLFYGKPNSGTRYSSSSEDYSFLVRACVCWGEHITSGDCLVVLPERFAKRIIDPLE